MKRCLTCDAKFSAAGWQCSVCNFEPGDVHGVRIFAPALAESTSGFKPEYHARLSELQDAHFWFQARNRLIVDALRNHLGPQKLMLEIGCGTGCVLNAIAEAFPESVLNGSEVLLAGLDYAAERVAQASFYQMDARHIPFDQEFDVVGAFDVLEHIKEDEAVMRQVNSALKRKGRFVITVPQHQWLWSAQDEFACHVRRYSAREIREKLVRSGFRVERTTSFVSLLLPAMMLSRLKKQSSERFDGLDELRLPAFLNRTLGAVMSIERLLILGGVRFLAGGSLLVHAVKE